MAILEKIRSRSIVLIIVIGLSLFAFVISDLLTKGGVGKLELTSNIGEINNEPVSTEDFRERLTSMQNQYRAQYGKGINLSNMQYVNFTWNEFQRNILYDQQFETVGLKVSPAQLPKLVETIYGKDPTFADASGNFSFEKFKAYLTDLKLTNPQTYDLWKNQEAMLFRNAAIEDYNALVSAGINANALQGSWNYHIEADKMGIDYVKIPYSKVPDSLVTVTDDEIEAYLERHQKEYQTEALRDLEYVVFEEVASKEDIEAIMTTVRSFREPQYELNKITNQTDTLPSFETVKDYQSFVNQYSDMPYVGKYLFKDQIRSPHNDSIFKIGQDKLYGPYEDNGYVKLVRKVERNVQILDSVSASHIIVSFKGALRNNNPENSRTKAQAKKYIDSLYQVVRKTPSKFADIAEDINTDDSKSKGGDIGWQVYSRLSFDSFDKAFADYMFFNDKGSIDIVETKFGYHIIRVDDRRDIKEAVLLAEISRKITPSEKTINTIFSKSTNFELSYQEQQGTFDSLARINEVKVTSVESVKPLDESIKGLDAQRQIVQWAFDENVKPNDTKRFNVKNDNVIVRLKSVLEEGTIPFDKAKEQIRPILIKQKKTEWLTKNHQDLTLETLSKRLNVSINSAEDISQKSPSIINVGREPKLVGASFSLKEGETSPFIQGDLGIYVIRLKKATFAPEIENYYTYEENQSKLYKNASNGASFEALKEDAEVEDNRALFY